MVFDEPDLEPAPAGFRALFEGQALKHLDEMVLSWRMGNHPIAWSEFSAGFDIRLMEGPARLFRVHAPCERLPARVEVDTSDAILGGIPSDMVHRVRDELARISGACENPLATMSVPLGKFSRGDRKVFLAYALTVARQIACPPKD